MGIKYDPNLGGDLMFNPEQPIQSSAQDLLYRHHFAKALSQSIISYSFNESIVVGLYGPWGSGKTSLINLITEETEISNQEKNKNEQTIIIRFNPWNFSDQNQLIAQFFKELSLQLKRKDHAEDAVKAGNKLESYAQFFLPLSLVPQLTAPALILSKIFGDVGKSAASWGNRNQKDLFEIRSELNTLLESLNSKILIIIDDVDRLNNTEIRQVFQLIKSLGDFPNTIYVVAFDKNIVVNALKKVQEGSGEEYLEKMIQIPFEIPPISQSDVEKLLFSEIDKIIKDIPESKWNSTYWGNIYHCGIKYFFKNLRDVARYINSLRFGFGIVKHEVNPIDFIALTCFQVFTPELYNGIRSNKDIFSGAYSGYGDNSRQKERDKLVCDKLISEVNEIYSGFIEEFLTRLFPKLASIYGKMNYGYDWVGSWRKEGRICSPDIFDVFFKLQIPISDISISKLERILLFDFNKDKFHDDIVSLISSNEIVRFLERTEDYTSNDIDTNNIRPILDVLYNLGDTIPDNQNNHFGMIDIPLRIFRITLQLLKRIENKDDRFLILEHAFLESNNSISVVVECVSLLSNDHGKYTDKPAKPIEEQLIDLHSLNQLEFITTKKVKDWIGNSGLFSIKRLPYVLYRLREWDPDLDLKDFLSELIHDDLDLIKFMESSLYRTTSQGMSDYVARVNWNINIESLKEFIDVEDANNRLKKFKITDEYSKLSDRYQLALNTFLDTFAGKIKDDFTF